MASPKPPVVLYVSSFPPRECGIATFTSDLTQAIDKEFSPAVESRILAMNYNGTSIYNYPAKVVLQINESDMEDYLVHANEINQASEIKLVNIQHEYGLHGGEWGNYLLPFMEIVRKPIIVTMHTVLPRPSRQLKKITQNIIAKASGVVVMTQHAARMLRQTYDVDKKKPVFVIPHGVQHVPFPSKSQFKKKLNLSGYTILSSFGMINPDKGFEYAIAAMPEIIAKYPNTLYLILGATHPVVARQQGEHYHNMLVKLVSKLKLTDHVKFYNKYMTLEEKIDFLRATDIYISPTLNPKQAVSGTVSDALSCACPVVVTANQYAKDVINRERGRLVEFKSSEAIKKAVLEIMDDPEMAQNMKKDAYYYSRHMTWQNVALAYFKAFNNFAKIMPRDKDKLPPINLSHLRNLTDNFGIIQFARHTKPDKFSGYCLDDNARALLGCVTLYDRRPTPGLLKQINTYFNYLKFSQRSDGRFYDFVNQNHQHIKESESDDAFGRAIWALGVLLNSQKLSGKYSLAAEKIWLKSQRLIDELQFSRSMAFSLIGLSHIHEYYARRVASEPTVKTWQHKQDHIRELIRRLSNDLLEKFQEQTRLARAKERRWVWFDDHLTYSNYKIPEALLRSYAIIKDKRYLEIASQSIEFLNSVAFDKGYYNAIGQDGWYFRDGKRAYFDQQPEDASSATEALITAHAITGHSHYAKLAHEAFAWFLGKNHLNQMIYDEATGGCYDGLGKHSINFNQGAESTISYFLARLAMEKLK